MRVLCEIPNNDIVQVDRTPEIGVPTSINGKYVIPIPEGSSVSVTEDSMVVPTADPNSVVAQSFAGLLNQFPMFNSVVYNALIEPSEIDKLDLLATFPDGQGGLLPTRAQTGRGTLDPLPGGNVPNMTAVLAVNEISETELRPGLLITNTIDITSLIPSSTEDCDIATVNEFLVWWKIYSFEVSEDVSSNFGIFAGLNEPSIKSIIEVDQEPSGLEVYISSEDGLEWSRVNRLTTVSTCAGTQLRLAFLNYSTTKIYIASYAILF